MTYRNLLNKLTSSFGKSTGTLSISGAICNNLIKTYDSSGRIEKQQLLLELSRLQVERCKHVVTKSIDDMENDQLRMKKIYHLYNVIKPPYHGMFQSMGRVSDGVKFLVSFRADMLDLISVINKKDKNIDSDLSESLSALDIDALRFMEHDLKDLLTTWFSAGVLQLSRLTWESPSSLLQKVAKYEAVHPIRNWLDMKQRVGPYRRSFIYTHPSIPGEPLVILHTALCDRIEDSMKNLIMRRSLISEDDILEDECELKQRKAVIFYSISSPHKGLKGIDLGNSLIKNAANILKSELPHLTTFSTLSPIPAFSTWLMNEFNRLLDENIVIPPLSVLVKELEFINSVTDKSSDIRVVASNMRQKLISFDPSDECPILRYFLLKLCCHYLLKEKYRGQVFDSVANFHLRNGAVIWRINWKADLSVRGINQSFGMMVNYKYYLENVDAYSEDYLQTQVVKASDDVINLLESNLQNCKL